ncbi:MAG TPA: hypothetical protein VMO00_18540 [Methylomirabilota bacterium]|nr:hypothetical protein [Methylomirabilota bacterium]
MEKSAKIKRELHNFWLKQLDQCKDDDARGRKDRSSQQLSDLASDAFFQHQLERLNRHAVKPGAKWSRITSGEKRVDAGSVAAPKIVESSHHAGAADKLRPWLDQNLEAVQLDGQFYVKAVDVLSLQQAEQDWNSPTSNGYRASYSPPDWLAIDDSLMWLAAPAL